MAMMENLKNKSKKTSSIVSVNYIIRCTKEDIDRNLGWAKYSRIA